MKNAYTLIEIMVVFLLLAILAGGVFVAIRTGGRQNLNAAASRITADINYAQSLAINKRDWYGIKFNTAANSYRVYAYDITDGTETLVLNPAKPGTNLEIVFDDIYEGISISMVKCDLAEQNNYIIFDADGIPSNDAGSSYGQDCQIEITNQSGDSRTVIVEATSGRVRLEN